MWVWKKLGFDNVYELPTGTLETLGRRCRPADSVLPKDGSQLQECIVDEEGNPVEFCPVAAKRRNSAFSQELKGTPQPWQLMPVGRQTQLCMPGSIELGNDEPEPTLTDSTGSTCRTVKNAIEKITHGSEGHGRFTWRIPKAHAKLTDMAAAECVGTPGPSGWPHTVVAAVVGAELTVTVSLPESVDSQTQLSGALPDASVDIDASGQFALVQQHLVQCEGFRVHLMQRGGPRIDPSKLHGLGEEDLAKELERWAGKLLGKRPNTWITLFVGTRASSTSSDSTECRSSVLDQPCHGRKAGDVVLAATAVSELTLEPFELSYGDQHIRSIRRMLEDEVAAVLGIKSSQVLCGDLQNRGRGPRHKHVRRDTVSMRFAILHEELATAREASAKTPFSGLSNASPPAGGGMAKSPGLLPPIGHDISEDQTILSKTQVQAMEDVRDKLDSTKANCMTVALKETMEAAIAKSAIEKVEESLRKARGSKNPGFTAHLSQSDEGTVMMDSPNLSKFDQSSISSANTSFRKSVSAPDLTSLGRQRNSVTTPQMTAGQALRLAGIETRQEKQPDTLLKALIRALGDRKHPMHRHLDVFPVLGRIPKARKVDGRKEERYEATHLSTMLVTHPNTVELANMAESFKETITNRVRPKKKMLKEIDDVDDSSSKALQELRQHVLAVEAQPDGELALKREQMHKLSPKALLDLMEASMNNYQDMIICLDVQIEQTSMDGQASEEVSLKLRTHGGPKRLCYVMETFKSDRNIIERSIKIFSSLTRHDPGTVDAMFEHDLAPYFLEALKRFPKSRELQFHGCRVLRHLYELSRRKALQGRRIVLLGKTLQEEWTMQGINHVLETISHFREDSKIQLEIFDMLVPLTDTIAVNHMSVTVFNAVEVAMRVHADKNDLLSHGIHAIARLGPAFMAHEKRGIRAIVEAMARHRSSVKLQRVGNKALFSLCGQEDSLRRCRLDGAVSAIVSAMTAHHKDPQVCQMGVRCLEKFSPRGVWKFAHICGDLVSVLPIVLWGTDPIDHHPPAFNLAHLRTQHDFEDGALLDNFHNDVVANIDPNRTPNPPSPDAKAGQNDRNNLATLTGYRRVGLRDEMDGSDQLWAVPGPPPLYPPIRVSWNVKSKDIKALAARGCDIEPQLVAGPRQDHIKLLCEALHDGLPSKQRMMNATIKPGQAQQNPATRQVKFGPEDAELFACVLGHFAWHSQENAANLVSLQPTNGVTILLKWLRCKDFTKGLDPAEASVVYPMQRACLAALACVCRHGQDCCSALLEQAGHFDVLEFVAHHDIGMRRSALRCLARLLPHSIARTSAGERLQPSQVWPVILKQLADDDEAIRAAAAACALEATVAGWAAPENFEEQEDGMDQLEAFITALVVALQRAVQSSSAVAALPVLLTIAALSADESAIMQLGSCEGLLPLLTTWPPRSAEATATGIDRAAAAAAAKALETLCADVQGFSMSVRDLQMLLTCASSDHTMISPTLREALEATLAVAVAREEDAGFLAQLLGTPVKAANGRFKLANIDALTRIAQKLNELIEKAPTKANLGKSDDLREALDHVEPLFAAEVKAEEAATLRQLLQELRNTAGGQDCGNQGEGSPVDTGTRLPPINRHRSV